ncbi:MAG: anthranilate synthase component I [Thaumarchaeota archaeon]|nr:anthranilate synthase component I [Nitrososphaerota archaeon]
MIYFGAARDLTETKAPRTVTLKKLRVDITPLDIYLNLRKNYPATFLLESVTGPRKLAEYSFMGFDPTITVTIRNTEAVIKSSDQRSIIPNAEDPFKLLRSLIPKAKKHDNMPRFAGGAVGYISYEAIKYFEKIQLNHNHTQFPDLAFGIYEDGIILDHKSNTAHYFTLGKDRLGELEEKIKHPDSNGELLASEAKPNITKTRFEEAVTKAKEYITEGDIFQVVLSRRIDLKTKGDLASFYKALRTINPSPYMYFLSQDEKEIIGSSPEMLVRVENNTVETFPIAGTRPASDNEAENQKLAKELLNDPKERAEHLMLVDLARNDVGRVGRFGTVRVDDFMTIQRFSHVQHIVSRVTAQLGEGRDAFDAMRAVFPAGTVSGAPKVRAMEIIDELEPSARGPYAGAVGYFSSTGDADFAITIRTLVSSGDTVSIQAGAGIVADSIPEREYEETERKAAALIRALEVAGRKRR